MGTIAEMLSTPLGVVEWFVYLLAAVMFVIGLHLMNSPKTARKGNMVSAIGMILAVVMAFIVLFAGEISNGFQHGVAVVLLIAGIIIGAVAGVVSAKKVNKAAAGHFKKANVAPKRTLREFRLEDISAMNVGDVLKADVFAAGDKVDVAGVSKGKGYQGVIKRYGQHRLRESHGTGPVARHAGSMGAISNPSRVFPGKRLPGHMGFVSVTVQNLTVVKVDAENNLIAVKGAVPGSKGTIVTLANSVKA